MKTTLALALLCTLPFSAITAPPKADPVTLRIATSGESMLTPASAFELRFENTMIEEDAVGKAGEESPLIIHPKLAGKWVWLSTQSGVFTIAEAPPLGATFQFALRDDLKMADGKPLHFTLKRTVKSPAFRLKGWSALDYWSHQNLPLKPRVGLCFSANVDAWAAAPRIWFRDESKRKVAARVEQADAKSRPHMVFPPDRADDQTNQTWAEDFQTQRRPAAATKATEDDAETPSAPVRSSLRMNQLVVTPSEPLPAGKGWQLVIAQGLQAAEGGYQLTAPVTVEIGEVKPFTVELATENLVNSGKLVKIKFSKMLGASVRKEPAKWVNVEPMVANFNVKLPTNDWDDRHSLVASGDFELGKDYTFTVLGETLCEEGISLGASVSKALSFAPVPARLYFQQFATHQQRSGTRQFRMMGVNVSKVRVSAKIIPAEGVTAAFDAYAKYTSEGDPDKDEWLKKVEDHAVPGSAVWEKDFLLGGEADEKKQLALNWDEILGPGKTGVVLLTAEQASAPAPNVKRVGTQVLVQVTDLGVLWKESSDLFLHVFSHATAQAQAGATVQLLGEKGEVIAQTKTAPDGTARLAKPTVGAQWLLVSHGEDHHLVNFQSDRGELEFGRFRINVWGDEEDIMSGEPANGSKERGLMFTDRPVYRPGEVAHLKAIVRNYASGKPHIPSGAKATLIVKGPRDRLVLEQKVTLSDAGSISADVALDADAVGSYRAMLLFGESTDDDWAEIACHWSAQEYQPNAFEVKVTPPRTPMLSGEIELPVVAKYYMGKPLAKAQLSWSVNASDERFTPTGFEDFIFTNGYFDWRLEEKLGSTKEFSAQGKVDLGEGGMEKIALKVPGNVKMPTPRRVRVLCEITDLNQQTVTERSEFTAHSSDFYLGLHTMADVVREGDALPLQLIAVRTDGTPLPEPVEATVKLTRINWQTNRVQDADEADNFRSEPLMQLVGEVPITTAKLVQNGGKWLLAEPGKKDVSFKADKPGLYLLTAVAKDSAGRDVITTTAVNVYGKDQLTWNYRNRSQVELVADKAGYLPGEEATILVKTPISGPALVTVERENVRRHFVVNLEGNAPAVRVPLEEGDAPNVFVSVVVLRGAEDSPKKFKTPEYRVGYTELKIARPDAKLYVNVKPAHPQFQPGEEVALTCEVRDVDGKAVRGAEVTLWAADEGVLSLTGFETPDPLAFFSRLLRLDVTTGLTLERLLGEDPDGLSFENKGYLIGGFGKGGDASVRRNFLGTAFWNSALRTDAEGKVTARFTAPDGLTRYRVMAVVQTKRDQFGHAVSAFEINKPFMLEPAPPRFASVGDHMLLRAVLHNTTAEGGEATVRVKLDGTAFAETTERKVTLPAQGSVAVDFPVEFREPGEANWLWSGEFSAGAEKWRDSVESKFKVVYPTPVFREVRQQRVDALETDLLAGFDPALLQGKGVIRVSVSNSRIFELREGVKELLHYPYGCVEQTTSSMLPWMALRDFRSAMPELNLTEERFKKAVHRGVTRLFTMQTGNGGLSYWPGGTKAEFWASAYGGLGIAMAQKGGYDVQSEDAGRLWQFLSEQLRGAAEKEDRWDLSPRALACYTLALAGRAESAYHEVLFKKRDKLTQESRALLALAVIESNGPRQMAETLLTMEDKAVEEDYWYGSIARAQGVCLLAWSRLSAKAAAANDIANALFEQRKNGHWHTTQGNAWALLGLGEYMRSTEGRRRETKPEILAGGAGVDFALAERGTFFEKTFPLDATPALKLKNPDRSRLYTQVTLEARPKTLVTQRQDRGYSVARCYQRINDDGTLSDLGEPRVGDRVLITLDFSSQKEATYLAINDPLPAVFEAVNPEFKTQEMAELNLANTWRSDFTELREDRALFFANTYWPGRHQIRYLARVRAAGTATAPPTRIEEMYHPERFGLGDSQIVVGKAL